MLQTLKNELMHFGAENDAHETERARRMLNITPDTGEFLSVLVRFGNARRVLEIGTGCGYQAAVLARVAREVYSIERLRGLHESGEPLAVRQFLFWLEARSPQAARG